MATRLNVHQLGDTAVNISITVADQTARFALTKTQVQKGDFVVQTDTGQWYLIIDDSKLNEAGGYQSLKSAPVIHASTHITGGSDVIANAVYNGASGLHSGADKKTYDDHVGNSTSAHGLTIADVVLTNDARIPSQDENNALAGTSGTPSSTNKYVTNADTRVPSQDENDALVGTSGTPSSTNKYVTDADTRVPAQDENNALAGTYGTPSTSNKYVTDTDPRIIRLWTASTSYAQGDLVVHTALLYRCITANSDSTFTAAKWYCLGSVMTGATSGAAGLRGLVPTPAAGDDIKMLHGDATYKFGRQFYNTGDNNNTNIGVDTSWYEFKKFVWPGSTTAGTPSSFSITIRCATAAIQYNCRIFNITDSTTFLNSGIVTSSSVIGYNTASLSSFDVVPTTTKLMAIQIRAAAGAKKNVQLSGSVLVIN